MVRAPAALDLGVSHILLSELIPELVDDPKRPRAYIVALQSEYARLAGMYQSALTAAMEPYLPIARVFALLAGRCGPAQRERLIQRVEATLRSEGQNYTPKHTPAEAQPKRKPAAPRADKASAQAATKVGRKGALIRLILLPAVEAD